MDSFLSFLLFLALFALGAAILAWWEDREKRSVNV